MACSIPKHCSSPSPPADILAALLRDGGSAEVEVEGPLLGIFPEEKFNQFTVQLLAGDRLLVYSDGIEVAFQDDLVANASIWKRELTPVCALPAEGMLIDFAGQIDQEVGSLSPKDDLTLVVLEVK